MQGSLGAVGQSAIVVDGLVGPAQQVECLLVEIFLVVEGSRLDGASHAGCRLPLVGIVVEGMDVERACLCDVGLGVYGLGALLQVALLRLLGSGTGTADEQEKE